jgi:uncharacterized protein
VKFQTIRDHLLKLDWDNRPAIARGLAIGFFFGMLPLLGAQIFIAIGLAHVLKASRAAALLMTMISNPFTLAPLYALCFWLGMVSLRAIGTDYHLQWPDNFKEAIASGGELYAVVFVGCVLLGLIGAIVTYSIAMLIPISSK